DTLNLTESGPFVPITFRPSTGTDAINVNTDNVGFAAIQFAQTQALQSLTIGTGGQALVVLGSGTVLTTKALSIGGTGKLDLNDNDLILDYTGASQRAVVQALVNSARAGGTWTGNGITSTSAKNNSQHNTTLGVLEVSEYKSIYGPAAQFDGQTIDTTAVLVKYTYYGDADFNGVVNFDDYSRIDSGFLNNRTGWLNGDFDGNGIVNFDDYSLIDLAFNTQGAPLRPLVASRPPTTTGSRLTGLASRSA
ncbi:MAG: hypothetical protein ABI833_21655, partial [Acidobacteriota bacterium]